MNCPQNTLLLNAYIDNELDVPHILEFEQHVETCHSCSERLRAAKALRNSLRNLRAVESPAPGALEFAIRSRIREADRTSLRNLSRWGTVAASLAAMALIGISLRQFATPRLDTGTAHDIVSSHVRSLIGNHLMDMSSSEQHTVKPWFAGKLDYSPPVRDFAPQGFPLAGSRIDYIASHPVAVLIYKRRQHIINYYVWPDNEAHSGFTATTEKGFHIEHWRQGEMNHWLVSDLNEIELKQFAGLLSSDAPHP
jgi:anti-sigma factor RsiW